MKNENEHFNDNHIHTTRGGRHFRHGDGCEVDGEGAPLETKLPTCELSGGMDGNVFAIIGKVQKTLRRAGQQHKADEFVNLARKAPSYDDVLQLCFDYVDVT